MSSYVRWRDIRAEHVERAGGEEAVQAGKQELLAAVIGHRLAEVRRSRGLTQQPSLPRAPHPRQRCPNRTAKRVSPQSTHQPCLDHLTEPVIVGQSQKSSHASPPRR